MPIDLDGLALIDTMLDKITELRLLPVTWTENQLEDLNAIHESLKYLNRIWQEFDDCDYLARASHELRTPIGSIIGYSRVLKMGLDGVLPEDTLEYVSTIETLANLILQKINYYIDKHKAKLGLL